jgi:peptide deformylase
MDDPIVQAGDPVLSAKATPVAAKDIGSPKIKKLIAKMKKVLAGEEYGVALAAPQIGESLRIFVVAGRAFEKPDESSKDEHDPNSSTKTPAQPDKVFINPTLKRLSKKVAEMTEGCLSVRGKYGTVMRHEKASVEALDESGKPFTYHGSGLIGHIFQHECDHLDGILYVDKAVKLEEDEDLKSARKKLKDKHHL